MTSWKIGRFFGIDLYIHWSFWLLPILVLWTQGGLADGEAAVFLLGILAAAFGCVVLHEYGHALAARAFGIGTRDITLYPIGGVARLESLGRKPWQEFWIALAGPAVNVGIVLVLASLMVSAILIGAPGEADNVGLTFLQAVLAINVGMVVFNLLPAFPLDGGRVLRALLAMGLGKLRATQVAARLGAVLAGIIAVGGLLFLGSPTLLIIGLFLFLAGQQELRAVEMEGQLRPAEPFLWQPADHWPAQPPSWLRPRLTVFVWNPHTGLWTRETPD